MNESHADSFADVELAARASYGRLLAWLTSRCGNIQTAEDALSDALLSALTKWPTEGVPKNTEAWLLTVARRRLIDSSRKTAVRERLQPGLRTEMEQRLLEATEASESPFTGRLPERRLELMFMCAHPDVPEAMRTPLMLQTVLGLNAQQIGSAMLVAPKTIGQRLVRVKRRIVDNNVPFEIPEPETISERLQYVLDAVYAAYGTGWDAAPSLGSGESGLAGEAIWLAGLLVQLLPENAEAKGLYSLLCLCESRRAARRTEDGAFVPLDEQDTSLWDEDLILAGERTLWIASKQMQMGRYLNEAAIHSHHAHRKKTGTIDWQAIHRAYRVLVSHFPSLGARIGLAASYGRIGDAQGGLTVLNELDEKRITRYQPYWAVRAWLLRQCGQHDAADDASSRAIGLSADPAIRAWLQQQRAKD